MDRIERVKASAMDLLAMAQSYANMSSGCTKVKVGSVIINEEMRVMALGANKSDLNNSCLKNGCYRIQKHGDNSKLHRNPDDCLAIHSEIDAISTLNGKADKRELLTIIVSRYPCEACARAIATSHIKTVIYGRKEKISELSEAIFKFNNIDVIHVPEFDEEDCNV